MAGEAGTLRRTDPRWAIGRALLVSVALAVSGCQRAGAPPTAGGSMSARETHHVGLRAERARLMAEQATPELLQAAQRTADPEGRLARQTQDALNQILAPAALAQLRDRLDAIYPAGRFRLDETTWLAAEKISMDYAAALERYRELMRRDDFQFPVDFLGGFLADLSFLDHATAAHRLEAMEAAEALHADRPCEGMLPLRNMFRITTQLGALKHLPARLTAARLRAESLEVVTALAGHAQADRELQRQLAQLVGQTLAAWPPDADAWIGDRALGIQAYDMVRGGQLLSLLTSEELETLPGGQDVQTWTRSVVQSLDEDEAFYLKTMRTLIDSCREPYYRRLPTLHACAARLDQLHDTPRDPFVASHVLLINVATAMQRQAADRARCEAWRLALAAATGDIADSPPINPLTGEPFILVVSSVQADVCAVDGRDPGQRVSIPVLGDTARAPLRSGD